MKLFHATLLFAVLLCFACATYAADPALFTDVSYDANNDSAIDLPGQLYVPDDYNASSSTGYSLVINFHGSGYRGTDNLLQISDAVDNLITAAASNDFFVYCPQTAVGSDWSVTDVNNAMKVMADISEAYNIDTSRMYAAGFSLGGAATWETTSLYADVLAAEAPICGGITFITYDCLSAAQNGDMAGEPIWAWHAVWDGTVPVSSSRDMVNAILTSEGESTIAFVPEHSDDRYFSAGTVQYTEYGISLPTHQIWDTVYDTPALYTWLLAQQSTDLNRLENGETVLFDIGNTATTTDGLGRTWNNTTTDSETSLHTTTAFAKMTGGDRSTISLAVVSGFADTSNNGLTAGTEYDDTVAQDGWYTDGEGILRLTGLAAGEEYRIEIFGSTSDALGQTTDYTIDSQTLSLTTYGNLDNTVVFTSVTADADGQIDISVTPGTGSTYGYISGLEVTGVPEPTTMLLLAAGGAGALLRRRRK